MDNRVKKLVIICDNDPDNSFMLEGELRNHDYEVVILSDATELGKSARTLRPIAVLANPDLQGFNEHDVCRIIKNELHIPLLLMVDKHSTHRAALNVQPAPNADDLHCQADEVISKPVRVVENVINLIEKQKALHQQNQ